MMFMTSQINNVFFFQLTNYHDFHESLFAVFQFYYFGFLLVYKVYKILSNFGTNNENLNMADDTIPCPVCNRQFPPKLVEEHVNKCLFLNTQTSSKRDGSHLQAVSPQEKRFKSKDANANIFKVGNKL